MVKDILCLKSLTEAFISNLAWRSLWQLSAAQTSPRREQWQTFCCKLPSSGELLNEVGCWKLFGFNPVSASLWLCRLLSILQSSTMMALSAYSLDITFRSLLPAGSPSWSVLFQQRGFYSASWDWTFPCVWGYPHSNCYTLWALRAQAGWCMCPLVRHSDPGQTS